MTMPLLSSSLAALHLLLFGSNPVENDVLRWKSCGFNFDSDIHWGLKQSLGGPCGILAAVQAYVIDHLLFTVKVATTASSSSNGSSSTAMPFTVTAEQADEALLTVLVQMLDRAIPAGRSAGNRTVCIITGTSLDSLTVRIANSTQARAVLLSRIADLRSDIGILLFVFSLLLTRSIEAVKADSDDSTQPLVARFGHTSQELVNLCLTGVATSNVFNNSKTIDAGGLTLRGISQQQRVGYLSLLECLRYTEVGSFFKLPTHPVFVIASESHFTVLFGLSPAIGQPTARQQQQNAFKRVFEQFDPQSNGYVPSDTLPQLLRALNCGHINVATAQSALDPDQLGIVLLQPLLLQLQTWLPLATERSAQQQTAPFTCAACTYNNSGQRSVCEMCNTARPPAPVVRAAEAAADSNRFTMYHYNGLVRNGNSSSSNCTEVSIHLIDGGGAQQTQAGQETNGRSLADVIQTRWLNALVEYPQGAEPRIT